MAFWLMKSEPDAFGIDDLIHMPNQTEHWDGIRNYQVRNMFRDQFTIGDRAFFYHSNCKTPGIVGTMEVVSTAYPDHTQFDSTSKYYDPKSDPAKPRWLMVDVKHLQTFSTVISLQQLKQCPELADMPLVKRGNRLSVIPVTDDQWQFITKYTLS